VKQTAAPRSSFSDFLRSESRSGIILIAIVILALIVANTPLYSTYQTILSTPLALEHNGHTLTILDWINDGLMAIFFLGIGMELKREITSGELASSSFGILPVTMAIGGMLAPAILYYVVNAGSPTQSGWAIPTATDIAFTLGIVSLLGKQIPSSLRLTIASLAIIDDLGAVVIIALFFNSSISLQYVIAVLIIAAIQYACSKQKKLAIISLLLFIPLWYYMLQSGIHATIAGIITGLLLPNSPTTHEIETRLNKVVGLLIVPIFAFANAAVPIHFASIPALALNSSFLGILLGLVIGKPLGIWLAARLTLLITRKPFPPPITSQLLLGASMLCGIGFTMSLFITNLAFSSEEYLDIARIGILAGSTISGIAGYTYLKQLLR
jgi:NhaA family Na+:H+ antiporter